MIRTPPLSRDRAQQSRGHRYQHQIQMGKAGRKEGRKERSGANACILARARSEIEEEVAKGSNKNGSFTQLNRNNVLVNLGSLYTIILHVMEAYLILHSEDTQQDTLSILVLYT